jgi:hypothetical protein
VPPPCYWRKSIEAKRPPNLKTMEADDIKPYGSLENPILTDGVEWQIEYLSRLRSRSGRCFFFHRLGAYGTSAMEHLADIYELIAFDNSERWVLAMSAYHTETSNHPPDGLTLRSFPRPMTFGVDTYVPNFPLGLPDILRGEASKENCAEIKHFLKYFPPKEWKVQKSDHILVAPEILQRLKPVSVSAG